MPEVHPNGFGDESKLNDARMLAASFSKGKSWKEATSFKEDNDRNGEESRRQTHQLSVVQRGRSINNSDRSWRQRDGGHSQPAEPHAEPIVVPIEMTAIRPRWPPQERQFSHGIQFYIPNDASGHEIDTTKAEQVLFELEPILRNKTKDDNPQKPCLPLHHMSEFAVLGNINVSEESIIEIDSNTLYPVSESLIAETEHPSRKPLEPFEGQIPDWAKNKETFRQMNASEGICHCGDTLKPAKNGLMSSRFADPQVHRLPSAGVFTLNLPVKVKVHEPECPLRRCTEPRYDEEPIVRRVEPRYTGQRW